MIPDDAVEAAAKVFARLTESEWPYQHSLSEARQILEAAAPHLMAPVAAELRDAPAANYEEDNYDAGYIAGLAFAIEALGGTQ